MPDTLPELSISSAHRFSCNVATGAILSVYRLSCIGFNAFGKIGRAHV